MLSLTFRSLLSLPIYTFLTGLVSEKNSVPYLAFQSLFLLASAWNTFSFPRNPYLSKCHRLGSPTTFNFKKYFLMSVLLTLHSPKHVYSAHWPSRAFCTFLMAFNIQCCCCCLFLSLLFLYVEFMYCHKRLQTISYFYLCLLKYLA